MHIYISGIGGAGMGPLALVAHQAGHSVSGSDKQTSEYITYLQARGIPNIHIGQDRDQITKLHTEKPIDWLVYSSAVAIEHPDHPELVFAKQQHIRASKRDELLNQIITDSGQKLVAIAGTHGKTTTTAMVIWLFKQLDLAVSYSVGAKLGFGDMGHFNERSAYFVYECDEFDRNFLAFHPYLSLITGVTWDHHEIYPTRADYQAAFAQFTSQSQQTLRIEDYNEEQLNKLTLAGKYNRMDGLLAIRAVAQLTAEPEGRLLELINAFPGLSRRMEPILPNLYSDYAHTPEKIRAAMSAALEIAARDEQDVVIIYEPLTDRRQHYMMNDYKDCFKGASQVYWLPSYLAREDPSQTILKPQELIVRLTDSSIAVPAVVGQDLVRTIQAHLSKGDMVVAMAGGGGGSLDTWLRKEF